jgi:hypothetical protein
VHLWRTNVDDQEEDGRERTTLEQKPETWRLPRIRLYPKSSPSQSPLNFIEGFVFVLDLELPATLKKLQLDAHAEEKAERTYDVIVVVLVSVRPTGGPQMRLLDWRRKATV